MEQHWLVAECEFTECDTWFIRAFIFCYLKGWLFRKGERRGKLDPERGEAVPGEVSLGPRVEREGRRQKADLGSCLLIPLMTFDETCTLNIISKPNKPFPMGMEDRNKKAKSSSHHLND